MGGSKGRDLQLDVRLFWVGCGLVIRNHMGSVMDTIAQRVMVNFSLQVVGAMAILPSLKFAIEINLLLVVIEFVALEVVNLINSGSKFFADIGLIVCDIKKNSNIVLQVVWLFSHLGRRKCCRLQFV